MKRKLVFVCLAAALTVLVGVSSAQAESVYNNQTPYDQFAWVPCANAGNGEWVELTGTFHEHLNTTVNDNRYVFRLGSNFQNVSGVGLTTGDKYQATWTWKFQYSTSLDTPQFTNNFQYVSALHGPCKDNNYSVKFLYHVTFTPDGTLTSSLNITDVSCD